MHINQLLFTELLVFEMSHIMLPKSQLLCTAYIVLYKKLKVIACQLPKDNTAYFDILKWLIWTFSTLEFLEITPVSVSYKLPQLYALYLAGFAHLSAPPRAQPWCRMMRVRKMQWRTFPSLSSQPPYAPHSHTRHWSKPA